MAAPPNNRSPSAGESADRMDKAPIASDVLICVDEPESAAGLFPHAVIVAKALGGTISLLHVMEARNADASPVDPIDWDIQKREMKNRLLAVAKAFKSDDQKIDIHVLEGTCAEQVRAFLIDRSNDAAVVLGESQTLPGHIGGFVDAVLTSSDASILLVPTDAQASKTQHYKKILVPIDGSGRSESALPKALRLAKAARAELVLCHVTPPPGLTQIGAVDREAIELSDRVTARNKRVGQAHLNRLMDSVSGSGVPITTRTVVGGDVRRDLIKAMHEEGADFIVMASHGQSGHADVPLGDVANHILKRSKIPVLMVRQRQKPAEEHAFSGTTSEGVRQPSDLKK